MIPINKLSKQDILYKYSNPIEVERKAKQLISPTITVYKSTKPDKKYMIFHNNKFIHFGQMKFDDMTKHNDIHRQNKFLSRNHKWKNSKMFSPAWLSYHLLW